MAIDMFLVFVFIFVSPVTGITEKLHFFLLRIILIGMLGLLWFILQKLVGCDNVMETFKNKSSVVVFCFVFFWIQFNVPFKIISLISRRANR